MKVGLVSEYYYPYMGGISEHIHNLYLQLRLLGHEAKIVTPEMRWLSSSRRLVDLSAPEEDVLRVGRSYPFYNNGGFVYWSWPFGLSRRLSELFERERFDLLHVHSPFIPILPLAALLSARSPVVGTFHTVFKRAVGYRIFRRQLEELIPKIRLRIAVTPECAGIMERYFRLGCKVIPNGIDTTMFQPGIPPMEEFGKGAGTKHILFLGRFDPHNGLDIALAAFALVRRVRRDVELIVVGSGPLAARYRRMARPLGGAVHFAGPQHRLRPSFYRTADIMCHPATLHATSLVNLEAMASGLPIVASDLPSFRWTMRDGALYFPKGDAKALAERLLHLLEDPSLCRDLGERARRIALEHSWERVGPRIASEYRRVLGTEEAQAMEEGMRLCLPEERIRPLSDAVVEEEIG